VSRDSVSGFEALNDTDRVSRDEQLLVGRHDPYLDAGPVGTDEPLRSTNRRFVAFRIQLDTQPLETVADQRANRRRVFADAPAKSSASAPFIAAR
jgi:hypothetical protein